MDDHPALLDALAKLISHAWIRWDNDAGRNTSFIDNLGTFVSCAENAGVSIGDSTVCGFNDPYYYPRYGYGTQVGKYLDSSVTVNNLALSGRSSKSFIDPTDNPNYAVLTSSIKAGDYLIIGFGHNDEKADSSLYTNPNTSGADGTAQLQAWVSDAPTSVDDTHTNIYGAAYYAYLIAHDLAASDSALGSYVLPGIAPPDISTLVPNPNYVPSPYLPPVKGTLWTTTGSVDRVGLWGRRRGVQNIGRVFFDRGNGGFAAHGSDEVGNHDDRRREDCHGDRRHRVRFPTGAHRQGLQPLRHGDGHFHYLQQQPGGLRPHGA
jgi:hypothetical protein